MPRKILGVLSDLFFIVKINECAKRAGIPVEFVKTEADALLKAAQQPLLIVVDLNDAVVDPIRLVTSLKSNPETSRITVAGFVSHVQAGLKQQAQQAGCDMVLARSAFSQNLPGILERCGAGLQ